MNDSLWGENATYSFDYRVEFVRAFDNKVLGVVGLNSFGVNSFLATNLHVRPSFRRRGIASALLQTCENICKNHCRNLLLYVDKDNSDCDYLTTFYQRRGFDEINSREASILHVTLDQSKEILFCKPFF